MRLIQHLSFYVSGWSAPALTLDTSSIPRGIPAEIVSVPVQATGPTGILVNGIANVTGYTIR